MHNYNMIWEGRIQFSTDSIQKSLKNNMFWMNLLDLVEDLNQWVWNVHISLEWWTWIYKYEKNIEYCFRKQWQENNV